MKTLFLLGLLSSACGNIDFTTRQGIIFFVSDGVELTKETADFVTDQFISHYAEITGNSVEVIAGALNNLQVVVDPRLYPCGYKLSPRTGLCAGLYYSDMHMLKLAIDKTITPPMTLCHYAYWHELTHHCLVHVDGIFGGSNEDPVLKEIESRTIDQCFE